METNPGQQAGAQRKFSFWRALENDYQTFIGAFLPLFFWLLYLIVPTPLVLYLSIAATVIGPLLTVLRLLRLRDLFDHGDVVTGKIIDIYFYRDRGRVEFAYPYQGKQKSASLAVHRSARTRALQPQQEVVVLVDPQKPERAIPRDLYS